MLPAHRSPHNARSPLQSVSAKQPCRSNHREPNGGPAGRWHVVPVGGLDLFTPGPQPPRHADQGRSHDTQGGAAADSLGPHRPIRGPCAIGSLTGTAQAIGYASWPGGIMTRERPGRMAVRTTQQASSTGGTKSTAR